MGKTKEDGIKSSMRKTPRNDIARLVPNKVIKSKTSNFVRKSQVQLMQPTKRSPTSSRQLLTLMPIGKNLHKVKEEKLPHVKSTGQRARPSNHLLRIHIIKTADNQTEQNLFLLINNKKTSQHIQISADPSTMLLMILS